jgi:hypothetical protein
MKTIISIATFIGKGILILIGSLILGYFLIIKEAPAQNTDYSLVPTSMLDSGQKASTSFQTVEYEQEK